MATVDHTATSFYAERKAALLAERGSVGKHDVTGNELPRLQFADKIALPALLLPFVARTLEKMAYANEPADGQHVYSLSQAVAGAVEVNGPRSNLIAESSAGEGVTQVAFKHSTVNARTILDWLRLGTAHATDPLIRTVKTPTGNFPYWYWATSDATGNLARNLVSEWSGLIKEASRPPAPGQVWLSRVEVQAFLSAFYRVCSKCNVTWAMETSWYAEAQETAKQATKDAASEIGEIAGEVANVAGDAVGRFGSSFLSQVGIVGAIFVVGLIYLKKEGIL